ncbi:MAG: hypothetical protein MJ175_01550 [Clostridia bacterium]|nr:hypothetical protein [Clostridia bacterium]
MVLILLIAVPVLIGLAAAVMGNSSAGHGTTDKAVSPARRVKTMKCPNCGSPARVNGKSWECGWCGDFGKLR